MDMPVDIKSVLDAAKKVEQARNIPVSAVVLVDETAPMDLITLVEDLFEPQSENARVGYYSLGSAAYDDSTDFVCIVAGGDRRAGQAAAYAREAGVPAMVVASSPDYVGQLSKDYGFLIPEGDLIDGSDLSKVSELMGKWALAVCKNKKLAVAQAYTFARRPLATESIKATSMQNAGIGAVVIIPGADMPVMTLNQVKMLLQIAAAYGQPMDAGRAKELAAVVGGGFAARAAARQLVGLVPVGGWAVKGGIGYSATMAMGYAALKYFEGGGGIAGLGNVVNIAGEKAVKEAGEKTASFNKEKVTEVASNAGKKVIAGAGKVAGMVKGAVSSVKSSR